MGSQDWEQRRVGLPPSLSLTEMNIPSPRRCRLSRANSGQKFGFHLTGQKNKPGETQPPLAETPSIFQQCNAGQCHISSVEEGSPAQCGGLQVEISNSSVSEEINRTVLTVNCDNKETDLNNNNNNSNSKSETEEQSYHLNIEIPGDAGRPSKTEDQVESSDDILVSLARSAKEMREIIMGRKKKDPRKEKRKDLRRRVEMIEEL